MSRLGKIVVTGASGFVGAALVEKLLELGFDVAALMRRPIAIERLQSHSRLLTLVADDWAQTACLSEAMRGASAVVHLASRNHRTGEGGAADPLYRRDILDLSIEVARAAVSAGVPRLVYLSSIKARDVPPGETRTAAISSYAFYKRSTEIALSVFVTTGGPTSVMILRPPLVYHADARGNFGTLVKLARAPLPLPIPNFPARRAMIARCNLIDAIVNSLRVPAERLSENCDCIFEVSDGRDYSLVETVRGIRSALRIRAPVLPLPAGPVQSLARWVQRSAITTIAQQDLSVDTTRFARLTGWSAPVAWPRGIIE